MAGAALLAGEVFLGGCQTASIDDLAPDAAASAPNAAQAASAPASADAPKNTGEFPKFGHIPAGETSQLGPGGTAALRNELALARAGQNAVAPETETYAQKLARLRRLGLLHGTEALAEIEGK